MITQGDKAHPAQLNDHLWGPIVKEVHWGGSVMLLDIVGPDVTNYSILGAEGAGYIPYSTGQNIPHADWKDLEIHLLAFVGEATVDVLYDDTLTPVYTWGGPPGGPVNYTLWAGPIGVSNPNNISFWRRMNVPGSNDSSEVGYAELAKDPRFAGRAVPGWGTAFTYQQEYDAEKELWLTGLAQDGNPSPSAHLPRGSTPADRRWIEVNDPNPSNSNFGVNFYGDPILKCGIGQLRTKARGQRITAVRRVWLLNWQKMAADKIDKITVNQEFIFPNDKIAGQMTTFKLSLYPGSANFKMGEAGEVSAIAPAVASKTQTRTLPYDQTGDLLTIDKTGFV